MDTTIGVIGLGYVGLPLGLAFAESGVEVIGFDVDADKVNQLNAGKSYIMHIPEDRIANSIKCGLFSATTDFNRIKECNAVIICVPTPLGKHREPDISYIIGTGLSIAPHIQEGTVVILESTTYPGTTDTELREVLEQGSGLKAGIDFHLAFSPEREDPGNADRDFWEIPKVVGGYTPTCLKKAMEVYGKAIDTLVPVDSCRVAEAVKLTENIFRAVNIAMVNELKMIYSDMSIDIWDVIDAAKTKPFGFMPFYPGPGLGGHCIPIDPFYLTWKAAQYGQHTRFIELAGEVNTSMPSYVVRCVEDVLEAHGKTIQNAAILILGIAYKANVDDDRESPAYALWDLLSDAGANVGYHDPHIPEIRPSREHSRLLGVKSLPLTPEAISGHDLVLIVTKHDAVDYRLVSDHAKIIVDTRNALPWMKGQPNYCQA